MEEDDDELANRKTNERIQLQPTCIRAGTLFAQHVQLFSLIHLCASKLNKLNEEENETATISNFLRLFAFHQCNEDVFIQLIKNNKFKNQKEN